jgi:hypothetical protein
LPHTPSGHAIQVPLQTDQPRREATLPPLAWTMLIVAGILLVLLVVGIAILIAILHDSRNHIRAQDAKTAVLLSKVRSAEPATQEAAAQALPLLRDARPVVRKVGRAIAPLTRDGSALVAATEQLPALSRTARALAAVALPVLDDVRRVDLARAVTTTEALVERARAEDLVGVAARAGRDTPRLLRRLLRIQLATLDSQRASLRTQLETLETQRQALVHIESIDRKTGGTVPAEGAPVPVP